MAERGAHEAALGVPRNDAPAYGDFQIADRQLTVYCINGFVLGHN